jgi:hypothetical protein
MSKRIVAPEWAINTRADRELVDDFQRGWGISSTPLMRGAPFTDFGRAHMAVPMGDSNAERGTRLHEMIHARISPACLPDKLLHQLGISHNAVRLAEEMRVNLVGRKVGLHEGDTVGDTRHLADGSESALAKSILTRNSWVDALSLYLTTYNTDVHKKIRRVLIKNKSWRTQFDNIEKLMKREGWNFDKRRHHSKATYAGYTDPHEYVFVDDKTGERVSSIIPQGFLNYTIPLAVRIDDWLEHPPVDGQPNGEAMKPRDTTRGDNWSELRFGLTSLTETTSKFIGRRKRPSMTGKYPSRPDRLLTDPERRIFREVAKGGNAVIVFDCSGSMDVTHETVRNAVEKFAGATIAVYSQTMRGGANAWVVARNGRMITADEFYRLPLGSGNGVDAPILRWAIKQKKTSKDFVLWVSDGFVTGENDYTSDELKRECALFSLRHNIIGVDTYDQALYLLDNIKKTGKIPSRQLCDELSKFDKGEN